MLTPPVFTRPQMPFSPFFADPIPLRTPVSAATHCGPFLTADIRRSARPPSKCAAAHYSTRQIVALLDVVHTFCESFIYPASRPPMPTLSLIAPCRLPLLPFPPRRHSSTHLPGRRAIASFSRSSLAKAPLASTPRADSDPSRFSKWACSRMTAPHCTRRADAYTSQSSRPPSTRSSSNLDVSKQRTCRTLVACQGSTDEYALHCSTYSLVLRSRTRYMLTKPLSGQLRPVCRC